MGVDEGNALAYPGLFSGKSAMIRSFYHHGAEQPASDLTPEQMRAALADAGGVLWVDLSNASPEETRKILGNVFGFPAHSVEACASGQRIRGAMDFGEHLLVTVHSTSGDPPKQPVTTCEIHCYVGRNFVVTHHTKPAPSLDRLAERVMEDEQLMSQGAYQLVCTYLHQVLEETEQLLNVLSAAEAGLEVEILTAPRADTLRRLLQLHRDVLKLEQVLQLNASALNQLASQELPNIGAEQRLQLRQLLERNGELLHTAAYLRELGRGMVDAYHLVAIQELNRFLRRTGAVNIILLAILIAIGVGIAVFPERASSPLTSTSTFLVASAVVVISLALLFHSRR